jgi:hypothetical protein
MTQILCVRRKFKVSSGFSPFKGSVNNLLGMSMEDRNMVEDMIADYGMDVETLPHTAPPGEEGFEFSHAGGEYEAFEGLTSQIAEISGWYVFFCLYDLASSHPK